MYDAYGGMFGTPPPATSPVAPPAPQTLPQSLTNAYGTMMGAAPVEAVKPNVPIAPNVAAGFGYTPAAGARPDYDAAWDSWAPGQTLTPEMMAYIMGDAGNGFAGGMYNRGIGKNDQSFIPTFGGGKWNIIGSNGNSWSADGSEGAGSIVHTPGQERFWVGENTPWYDGQMAYEYDTQGNKLREYKTTNPAKTDWGEMAALALITAISGGAAAAAMAPAGAAAAGGAGSAAGAGAAGGGLSTGGGLGTGLTMGGGGLGLSAGGGTLGLTAGSAGAGAIGAGIGTTGLAAGAGSLLGAGALAAGGGGAAAGGSTLGSLFGGGGGSSLSSTLIKQLGSTGLSALFGGGGGSSATTGGGGSSGGFGLNDLIGLIGGGVDASRQGEAAEKMMAWLNSNQAKMDGFMSPDSPEYNAMWEQMSRKDAAAGRNSQYGPRTADFLANVAKAKADNTRMFTTGNSRAYADALNQDAGKYAGLSAALQRSATGGGSGGGLNLSSLLNLFSGGSGGATDWGSLFNDYNFTSGDDYWSDFNFDEWWA